jgi:hypothetical protein
MLGSALLIRALWAADGGDLPAAIAELSAAARDLPAGHRCYPDTSSDLALARLIDSRRRADPEAGLVAVRRLVAAATGCPENHPRRAMITLRAAGALMAESPVGKAGDLDQAVDLLGHALRTAGLNVFGERSRCLYGLGHALFLRYQRTDRTGDLDEAITALEEARAAVLAAPGDPLLIPLLRILALAYRAGGAGWRHGQALSTGRSLLHEHGRAVLIQIGSHRGLAAARRIGADTLRLADWYGQDGDGAGAVEALELGRGLVLHSATVSANVSQLLRDAGFGGLAAEWELEVGGLEAGGLETGGPAREAPSDLRSRVLTALAGSPAELRLISAPTVAEIAAGLRAGQIDALVYLIPASQEVTGRALIVSAEGNVIDLGLPALTLSTTGPLARYLAANRDFHLARGSASAQVTTTARELDLAIGELCDWAWPAAMDSVLANLPAAGPGGQARLPRLAIAPVGALGIVPWHAARRDTGGGQLRYACADAVLSTCASARQLIDAAGRGPIPAERLRVIVGNPTGDLLWAGREADSLCAVLYPGAIHLGRSEQLPVSGPGSPAEVLAYLPGGIAGQEAGLLHLGCHAQAADRPDQSRLRLAGGDLTLDQVLVQAQARGAGGRGALVILSACTSDLTMADHDEALTLASAFMAAGATGVVGSRWTVPDQHTALLMYALHDYLVKHPGESAARALRAAQLWMLDPGRQPPDQIPEVLAARARASFAAKPIAWAAFTCHGL